MKRLLSAVVLIVFTSAIVVANDEFPIGLTLWQSPSQPAILTAPSHRIPALARCSDGSLVAVADYRLHLSDVGVKGSSGVSQIELRYRRSMDGGQTWTEQQTVCERNTSDQSDWRWAMGDASIIADRESGEVLMMCAAGSVGMGASTAANPIKIGCFRSTDNGVTWDAGTEMTSDIYSLYGNEATALFITSGSMCQSSQIKVGDYYRIYVAFPIRTRTHGNGTGVIFSDDFGRTWSVLGPIDGFAEGLVYEEGKVAELPDGSVALMVRDDNGTKSVNNGKKNFCRYIYNNVETGDGEWTVAASGITGMCNACNSTLLIVPAIRTSDNAEVSLALVALPFHDVYKRDAVNNYGRKDVGFVFKEIASESDYTDGLALASGWQRGLQITDKLSAYTDLVALDEGRVGLLFEDNGKQGRGLDGNNETEAYDIVFHSLELSDITGGLYTSVPEESAIVSTDLDMVNKKSGRLFDISGAPLLGKKNTIAVSDGKKFIVR